MYDTQKHTSNSYIRRSLTCDLVPVSARNGCLATNAFAAMAQSLILGVDTWPIRTVAAVLSTYHL